MSKIWRYIPAILCMLAIFISSSRSGDQLDSVLPWVQKWLPGLADFNPMHYVAYFILGLTIAFAMGKRAATWTGCLLNIVICVVYGLTDEWHQSFVPMRTPDPLDLLHDGIGAGVASLLVLLIYTLLIRRNPRKYTS
ncbi:VanZ family protein [Cohnella sp. WQ 127256]|uniref:VanZ family protein n=1 Tax=Cohnella sp. WQ 127256 TaxID=2938790 RepID=UPI0021189790|nr:VanZ family protein [Cohnella sp. WQ 127256]